MIAVSLKKRFSAVASALSNRQNCACACKHNEDGRTAPGVCGNGSVPLSHSGNVVTRIGIHTQTQISVLLRKSDREDLTGVQKWQCHMASQARNS